MLSPIPAGDLPFWDALVSETLEPGDSGKPGGRWIQDLLLDAVTYHLLDGERHPMLFAVLCRGRSGVVGSLASRVLNRIPEGRNMEPAMACVLDAAGRSGERGEVRPLHPLCELVLGGGERSGAFAADFWRRLLLADGGDRLGARGVHLLRAMELWKGGVGVEPGVAQWASEQQRAALRVLGEALDARGRTAALDTCGGVLRVTEGVRTLCGVLHRMQASPEARRGLASLSRAAADVGRPVPALRVLVGALGKQKPAAAPCGA